MRPEFTPDGIQVQTFDEIYQDLADGYRDIYGEDINLDPDSPDGQRVGIEAQARLDLQSFALTMYQQMDPNFAFGQSLNRIIKLAGLTRRPATRSQADVTITTDRALTLPADYAVEDDLGQSWTTLESVSLSSGTTTVTLFSEVFGAIEADAGTITQPATVVLGVTGVTNTSAAVVGIEEETDEELRVRRNQSLSTPQSSGVGRMMTALGNLANVTDLMVYENDTDSTDSDSIPSHSLWAIIEGGAVNDIAEVMAKNKTSGTGLKGTVSGEYSEQIIRPDGSTYTLVYTMVFDRPTYVDLQVRLDADRKDSEVAVDTELIAEKIADRSFTIGENLATNDLYEDVFKAGSSFVPKNLEVSSDGGGTWVEGFVESEIEEKFRIDADDVTVTDTGL